MRIDPCLLDAVWQLVSFHDQEQGLPGQRFPLALESLLYDDVMPGQGWIWLWRPEAEKLALTVQVVDLEGRPRLCMDGLFSERLEAFSELLIEPEVNI